MFPEADPQYGFPPANSPPSPAVTSNTVRTTAWSGPAHASDRRSEKRPRATASADSAHGFLQHRPPRSGVQSSSGTATVDDPPRWRSRETWPPPDSAPSTLACAVSSTELNGTGQLVRQPAHRPRVRGILASCSPMPGTGSSAPSRERDEPPREVTPRARLPAVLRRGRFMSHLPRPVPPHRACAGTSSPFMRKESPGAPRQGAVTHRHGRSGDCTNPRSVQPAQGVLRSDLNVPVLFRVALILLPVLSTQCPQWWVRVPLRDVDAGRSKTSCRSERPSAARSRS